MARAALLRSRRFLPLFVTQALGAFNDNLFKNALAVLALFASARWGAVLVAAGLGVFILPYVLFSALAGSLAERTDKARLIRLTKWLELALMLLGAAGFLAGSIGLLMAVLFGLGVQATFFGPLKYGILPEHLAPQELLAGNGLIEAATFLAILAGTVAGAALVRAPFGPELVAGLGVAVSVAGLVAAWRIPPAPPVAPGLAVEWSLWHGTARLVALARADAAIWRATLGISWFWALGAVVLAELPVAAKEVLGADSGTISVLLAVFAAGVGTGSVGCARLLHGRITLGLVRPAWLGLSLFCADLAWSLPAAAPFTAYATWPMAHVLADLFALAACGGAFSVSLYAFVQHRAVAGTRARMIAAGNVLNAAFMVAASGVAMGLAAVGAGAPAILGLGAAANLAVLPVLRGLPRAAPP